MNQLLNKISIEQIFSQLNQINKDYSLVVWEQFVKWSYKQFQQNKHVSLGEIGQLGFKIQQQSKIKIPHIFFNEGFCKKYHILLKIKNSIIKPTIKINYTAISKNILEKNNSVQNVKLVIQFLINFIQKSLKQQNKFFILIDLDFLGKIIKKNHQIWFQYTLPKLTNQRKNSSIRIKVNKETTKIQQLALNKMSLLTSREGFLPKIEIKEVKHNQKQKQTPRRQLISLQKIQIKQRNSQKRLSLKKNLPQQNKLNRSSSLKQMSKSKTNFFYKASQKQTRKSEYQGWQMMGAGPDPLKKSQIFSKLTSNLKDLMQTKFNFQKPKLSENIPLIDTFSRTRASPIASQRLNPLVCARIGGNFCLSFQNIMINQKGIQNFKLSNQTLASRIPKNEQNIILSRQDQYHLTIKQNRTEKQESILNNHKNNYKRYLKLFQMINLSHIYPLTQQDFQRIKMKTNFIAPQDSELFEQLLEQYENSYNYSIKKSIVDYILLDPTQKQRLSTYIQFKPVSLYGSTEKEYKLFKQITFSFSDVKKQIEEKLFKNSKNVLKIVKQWQQSYQNLNILILSQSPTDLFTVEEFCDKQKIEIRNLKKKIINEWIIQTCQTYKKQIISLKNNVQRCNIFFESTSILLYKLVRQLIYKQILKYNEFFEQYNLKQINPPQTVVYLERTIGRYQRAFISVRLSHKKQGIYFMDNMNQLQKKFIEIMNLLRQLSVNLPKPESLITKTDKPNLTSINEDELQYKKYLQNISIIIKKNVQNAKKCLEIYQKYSYLLLQQHRTDLWVEKGGHDRRQYAIILKKYKKLYEQIMDDVPFFIKVNMIQVDANQIKRYFLRVIENVQTKIQFSVYQLIMKKNSQIHTSLVNMISIATSQIKTCQKLVEVQDCINNFKRKQIKQLQSKQQDLMKWISITLYNTFYPVSSQDLRKIYMTSELLRGINQKLNHELINIESQRHALQTKMRKEGKQLQKKVTVFVKQVQKIKDFGSFLLKQSALKLTQQFRQELNKLKNEKSTLNHKQMLLGLDQTQLAKLIQWDKILTPLQDLWKLIDKFMTLNQSWIRQNILKHNITTIQSQCRNMSKLGNSLMKQQMMKIHTPVAFKLISHLIQQIRKVENYLPIFEVFSNPGLKQRHFQQIIKFLSFDIKKVEELNVSLSKLLSLGANNFINELKQINQIISKEYNIEFLIKNIKNEWQKKKFEMIKYKNNQNYLIDEKNLEQIKSKLDNHLLQILTVKGSKFSKIFMQQLQEINQWLSMAIQIVEQSQKIQNFWIFFQPLMNLPDILKYLSIEGTKFMLLDKQWNKITNYYNQVQLILQITKNKQILKQLKNTSKNIQSIQKGLGSFLESKRMSFPRFFFLSDDQLLQVLRQGRNIKKVQKYFHKCFEGIQILEIEQNQYITGLYSKQFEYVPFTAKINISLSKGNIDELFKQVQDRIKNSIRKSIENLICQNSQNINNFQYLKKIGMVINIVQKIKLTHIVEQMITKGNIKSYESTTSQQFMSFINSQKLSKFNRIEFNNFQNLVVLLSHKKQMIRKLSRIQIQNINEFQWISQLRYYFNSKNKKTQVKVLDRYLPFSHQYLGNKKILVITPLSDRFFRTACLAIQSNYGMLVFGQIGTGKSSTIRQLSRSLAIPFISLNCTQNLNLKEITKYFKGITATGYWGCFDNINKINPQILSVLAQQMLIVQRAKNKNSNSFLFEDIQIPLKPTVNYFITINYLQLNEILIPKNLKQLFRPFYFAHPDYNLITQILLYCYGLQEANELTNKILKAVKLASELINQQEKKKTQIRTIKDLLKAFKYNQQSSPNSSTKSSLVKSFNDIFLPKISKKNLLYYKKIIVDVFQSQMSQIQEDSNVILTQMIKSQLNDRNWSNKQYFQEKISQIYKLLKIKKGIIIIGQSCTGKSNSLEILKNCLNNKTNQLEQKNVQITKIYHKSYSIQNLLFKFYQNTQQQITGIIPTKLKEFSIQNQQLSNWLVFDGFIGSKWAEYLNTALDDNRKVYLNNGEFVQIRENVLILFETENLMHASPSIINRCGICYFEADSLNYKYFIQKWKLQQNWANKLLISTIHQFFSYFEPIVKQFFQLNKIFQTSIFNTISTFINIFNGLILKVKNYFNQNIEVSQQQNQLNFLNKASQKQIYNFIGGSFFFSVIWSFGTFLDQTSKHSFDIFLKRFIMMEVSKTKSKQITIPEKGSFFDNCLQINIENQKISVEWKKWSDYLFKDKIDNNIVLHSLLINTSNTVCYKYLIQILRKQHNQIILCGPTASGKTVIIDKIQSQINQNKNQGFRSMVFSTYTPSQKVQNLIERSLKNQGSKTLLRPINGKKLTIFIDDLHMVLQKSQNLQSPVELIREIIQQKGLFDLESKQKTLRKFTDISFFCSMRMSQTLSKRFSRHLNFIFISQYNEQGLNHIFTQILNTSFLGHPQYKNIKVLLKYCLQIYQICLQKFIHTQNKLHYNFNLRDLSRLIIGICKANKEKIHSQNIGRLWAYQAKKIFKSKLLPNDQAQVEDIINNIGKKWGKNVDNIYFTDLLSISSAKSYEEVNDLQKIRFVVKTLMNNYNINSQRHLNLILFKDALEHILNIYHSITSPTRHSLLIGTSGSGRRSSAIIAAYIAQYQIFIVDQFINYEVKHFKKDLKRIFIDTGFKNKQICWIIAERNLQNYAILDIINDILKLGKISNIFTADQKRKICHDIQKNIDQQMSQKDLMRHFFKIVKNNLHFIFNMNPADQQYGKKLKDFPSLIDCTIARWFDQWPSQSLIFIANQVLHKIQIKHKDSFIKMIQCLHSNSRQFSQNFNRQKGQSFYLTPNFYINFLNTFKKLLLKKRKQIKQNIYKYENNHSKIIEIENNIEEMKNKLEQIKTKIMKASEDLNLKTSQVRKQNKQADLIQEQVIAEKLIVNQAINQANQIKKQCQQALQAVLPKLKEAEQALIVLDKNSLIELKSMNNPPSAVKLVLQGLCLLIDPNPKQKIKNQKSFKMQTDWWAASVRNLGNMKLLDILINFNKQCLNQKTINVLTNFLNDPFNKQILTLQNVAKSSIACECIIKWIYGIHNFYFVNQKVKPKQQSLQLAEKKVKQMNITLQIKLQQLRKAKQKVQYLNFELQQLSKTKIKLEQEYNHSKQCCERAINLIQKLSDSKNKWFSMIKQFKCQEYIVDPTILICSAHVNYLGFYQKEHRKKLISTWRNQLIKSHLLKPQDKYSLIQNIGNPLQIKKWNIQGLPNSEYFIQNGLIVYNTQKWPLIIDPQNIASTWLQSYNLNKKIKVIRTSQNNYLRTIQNCIQFGNPVLIENLQQKIPISLNPILFRRTYKKGPTTYLKIGQNNLIYSNEFLMYMITRLRHPKFNSQICSNVTIINFSMNKQVLKNKLLSLIVNKQRPDLEESKIKLMIQQEQNLRSFKQIQDKILTMLSSLNNILSDLTTINQLTTTKQQAEQILQKQKISKQTQSFINQNILKYLQIVEQANYVYLAMDQLSKINPQTFYNLSFFNKFIINSIQKTEKYYDQKQRIQKIKINLVYNLFKIISSSLTYNEKDLFAILIVLNKQKVDKKVLQFLIQPQNEIQNIPQEYSNIEWLDNKKWNDVIKLEKFQTFKNLSKKLLRKQQKKIFGQIVKSQNPYSIQLSEDYKNIPLQLKLMMYKTLRPQKIKQGLIIFTKLTLGQIFLNPIQINLEQICKETSLSTPILFYENSTSDMYKIVQNLSKKKQIVLETISLGKGQQMLAERLIRQSSMKGNWIMLQNCHLAQKWMQNLTRLIEDLKNPDKQFHQNFRIWLTIIPSNFNISHNISEKCLKLSASIISQINQNSIKQQQLLKSQLKIKLYSNLIDKLRKFHLFIKQKCSKSQINWGILYEINQNDLRLSSQILLRQVQKMNNQTQFQFKKIRQLIGQYIYGAKVTNQEDKKELLKIFENIFSLQYNLDSISILNYKKQSNHLFQGENNNYICQQLQKCLFDQIQQ